MEDLGLRYGGPGVEIWRPGVEIWRPGVEIWWRTRGCDI